MRDVRPLAPDRNPGRTLRTEPFPLEWPGRPAWLLLAALVLVLVLSPPARNAFWAVNAFRSVAPLAVLLMLLGGALAAALIARPPRRRLAVLAIPALLAGAVAFPFQEIVHGLGDTFSRWGAIANYAHAAYTQPFVAWARALHAAPLDAALWLGFVGALTPPGTSPALAIGLLSWGLGGVYFAATWRIANRLDAGRGLAWGLWLALVSWGGLLAFASYAESAGVSLALNACFWAVLLVPLDRPRRGVALVVAWALAALAHRTALGLLVPAALRVFGPAVEGDTPAVRRATALGMLAACVAVLAVSAPFGSGQLGSDFRELWQGPAEGAWGSLPTDLLNLLVLIAPLAIFAPALAGRALVGRVLRAPRILPVLLGVLVFVPLAFPLPVCGSGLGVYRDWDLTLPLAFALTLAATVVLSELPVARLRGALLAAVPVLVLNAGGWLAIHHDPAASLARIEALVSSRPTLGPMQRSSALFYLGDYELAMGHPEQAARRLEQSWSLMSTPARGLHAVLAWVAASRPDSAARMLAAVRARGPLSGRNAVSADSLAARIRLLEAARPAP